MLKFSRRIDYALVALAHLARVRDGNPVSAKEIADAYHLPRPLLSNIMKHLCREGLVTSVRGVRGGYRLERPASEITLGDLVEALEGPVRLTLCASGPGGVPCAIEGSCPVRTPIRRFHETIGDVLAGVTLADLSAGTGRSSAARH